MSTPRNSRYRRIVAHAIAMWTNAHRAVAEATTAADLDEALERFHVLREALASCAIEPDETRHQQALLVLLEDTVIWAETTRDGGDADAAQCDVSEAYTIVCLEADRLFGSAP